MAYFDYVASRKFELLQKIVDLIRKQMKRDRYASQANSHVVQDYLLYAQIRDELLMEQYLDDLIELMKFSQNGNQQKLFP